VRGGLATFGILATVDALVDLSRSTIQASIDFERLTASFRALIGDKERADKAILDIQKFALETPFDVTNVALASKTLLGYGISVNELIPTLKRLGDVSAASGGDIQRVALAYGQIAAKGKLQGEEIRQLVNVGFNPLQEIAKRTGETMSLSEQINLFKIEIGGIAAEELRPFVESLSELFKNLTESTKEIRSNALTLSLWKAALIFIITLLAKKANLLVLNILNVKSLTFASLNLKKVFDFLKISLITNTALIGNQTTAQKLAVASTVTWDVATKALNIGIGLLSKTIKGLFTLLASNPIGIAIAGWTIYNGLIERNNELLEEDLFKQKGIIDAAADYRDQQEKLASAQKASAKTIAETFGPVIKLVGSYGNLTAASQKAIKELETEYGLRLDLALVTKNQGKALEVLNKAQAAAQQIANLELAKQTAQENIKTYQDQVDRLQKLAIKQTEVLDVEKERLKGAENFKKSVTGFDYFKQTGFSITGYIDANRAANKELEKTEDSFFSSKRTLESYNDELKSTGDLLTKAQGNLFNANQELTKVQREWIANEKGAEKLAKALEKVLDFIDKINQEIDKLVKKNWLEDIRQLQDITQQEQVIKLKAQFDVDIAEANVEKGLAIKKLDELLEEYRKAGASQEKITELKNKGVFEIEEEYRQKELLATKKFGFDKIEINKKWREEDLKELRKYTDDSLKQLIKLRNDEKDATEESIDILLENFKNSRIGRGKEYKKELQELRSDVVDNIRLTGELEDKRITIDFQRKKDEIDKKFKYEKTETQKFVSNFIGPLTKEQQEQLAKDNQFEIDNATQKENAIRTLENDTKNQRENNRKDTLKKQQKFEEGMTKAEKDAHDARINRIFDEVQASVDAAFTIANAAIEAEMMKNDALIALQEDRVERAKEIADEGNAELFEAEKKRLTDLQKERAKFVRQQQALIFAQTVAEASLAVARAASTGSGILSPILVASVIASITAGYIAARAATQSAIGGFAEGGWTGKGGKYEPAGVVHREEFVVKKGPAERWRPMLEQINKGRDPYLATGMGKQVIMINNVGVEERLSRIEKAIVGQDRMQLTIDESGIHGLVSHYQWKNDRIRNRAK